MIPFFRKLHWLRQRANKEADLREELRFHLEEEAEERQGGGLREEKALWAARRELGNLTLVEEDTRAVWGWTMLEQFGQDVRYACRTMTADRLFTLLAVLSLALLWRWPEAVSDQPSAGRGTGQTRRLQLNAES